MVEDRRQDRLRVQFGRRLGRRLAEWTATYVHGVKAEHPGLKLAQRRPPHE